MTEEFDTAGVLTGTWWSSSTNIFSGYSLPSFAEIAFDVGDFEWQNIDVKTDNVNHLDTNYAFLANTNLDSSSQISVSNQSNLHEEEKFSPIYSFLEGLLDSNEQQLSISDSTKQKQLENFHFFKDIFLNDSEDVSVFNLEIKTKLNEETNSNKSLITCKSVSSTENTEEINDIESSAQLKRPRLETPLQLPSFKVRNEKFGDRITALQQLVSPFGKTDTASVLHDAIGYIKFMQEKITVSSNPLMDSRGSVEQKQCSDNNTHEQVCSPRHDLRSRGLCLMPISSTFSVTKAAAASSSHVDTSSFCNLPFCVNLN